MSWEWNAWTIVWFVGACVAGLAVLIMFFAALDPYMSSQRGTLKSKKAAKQLSVVMVAGPVLAFIWPATLLGAAAYGVTSVFREAVAEIE